MEAREPGQRRHPCRIQASAGPDAQQLKLKPTRRSAEVKETDVFQLRALGALSEVFGKWMDEEAKPTSNFTSFGRCPTKQKSSNTV